METIWFVIVAAMLTTYVVLDGFDLGASVIHLWVARSDVERRLVLQSIGPVWDGNEVWLLAAGGTLYFAFPALYASSFSGFYLPLMMVLWLLVLRGISVEFRNRITGGIWSSFWDGIFCLASLLLAVFFGAALGNVVRGVPLDSHGLFFEPLWTTFLPRGSTGILDWYTILVAITALAALTMHGALWLALKTDGDLQKRARTVTGRVWWALVLLTVLVTWTSFRIQPQLSAGFAARPWEYVFPALAVAGLIGAIVFLKEEWKSFVASCAYLVGMLTSVTFALYPDVLPASSPAYSLTVENAKAADYGLKIGLVWWIIGIALATAYTIFVYRSFRGKVRVVEGEEPY
ncbi:MAG TPA: cytochrome d ubiquinol oxidase subunit II [Candidatus Acidoferrales bacterium]|nr:cytochrome d ubiquinol oxidase subunit II [Candidatus Acidoferrales bacterium]